MLDPATSSEKLLTDTGELTRDDKNFDVSRNALSLFVSLKLFVVLFDRCFFVAVLHGVVHFFVLKDEASIYFSVYTACRFYSGRSGHGLLTWLARLHQTLASHCFLHDRN